MNYIIDGPNVRILARIVILLSKLGTVVHLEAEQTGLKLKSMNASQTSCTVVKIDRIFFQNFALNNKRQPSNSAEETECKVFVKPLLKIFKSLDKILQCKLWLQRKPQRLVVRFECKSQVTKTHYIHLLEMEKDDLRLLRFPDNLPNYVTMDHKTIANILVHFKDVQDLTIDATADEMVITNHNENSTAMRSTVRVSTRQFKAYQLNAPSQVTTWFAYLKAVASFAKLNKISIRMNFDQAGRPIHAHLNILRGVRTAVHVNVLLGTMKPRNGKQQQESAVRNQHKQRLGTSQRPSNNVQVHTGSQQQQVDRAHQTQNLQGISSPQMFQSLGTPLPVVSEAAQHASSPSCTTVKRHLEQRNDPTVRNELGQRLDTCHKPSNNVSVHTGSQQQQVDRAHQTQNLQGISSPQMFQSLGTPLPVVSEAAQHASSPSYHHTESPPQTEHLYIPATPETPSEQGSSDQASQTIRSNEESFLYFPGSTNNDDCSSATTSNKRPGSPFEVVSKRRTTHSETMLVKDTANACALNKDPSVPEAEIIKRRKQDKIRRVLAKCFESTFDPGQTFETSQIFAEDSPPNIE